MSTFCSTKLNDVWLAYEGMYYQRNIGNVFGLDISLGPSCVTQLASILLHTMYSLSYIFTIVQHSLFGGVKFTQSKGESEKISPLLHGQNYG
jgi:hypothetical protein